MFHIDQLCCSGKNRWVFTVGRKKMQTDIFQVSIDVGVVWFIYFNIPVPE